MNQQRVLTVLGVVALVAIVGAVAAFATGGGDDPKVSVAAGSTTSSSAVSAPVPSTSTTVATPTTVAGQPTAATGNCSLPEDAAKAFVDGWIAGDRAAAERCGSTDAANTMFQTNGAGAQYAFQGCDYTDPGVPTCSYTYPGGAACLTIEGTEAAGWKVTRVSFTAD